MTVRRILLTGFGAFEDVHENPSGALAREFDGFSVEGPGGGSPAAVVSGAVLPVSFERAPRELDALVGRVRPDAIVALGVHPGEGFRIESGAVVELTPGRPDADGMDGSVATAWHGPRLRSGLDLGALSESLARAGEAPVRISDDAGRYVCERIYRRVLEIAERDALQGVFLHVPPVAELPLEQQRAGVCALLESVGAQLR